MNDKYLNPWGMPALNTIAEEEDLDTLLDCLEKISESVGYRGDFDYACQEERQYFLTAPQACKNRIKSLFLKQEDSKEQ